MRAGSVHPLPGPVAQFGRAPAWHAGSRQFKSDRVHHPLAFVRVVGYTLGGFVAGEGSFIVTTGAKLADGSPRVRWVFDISVARRDQHLLVALQTFLGVGSVYMRPPRTPKLQPISSLTVSSRKAHRERVIPFAEHFLLPCAKRRQFELWRDALYHYESVTPPRRRSTCSVEGCQGLVRGRRLCRSHYYRATGY